MSQFPIFALKDDLLSLVNLVESKGPLKFTPMGNFAKQEVSNGIKIFKSGPEIPNLGKARADASTACAAYLACEVGTAINLRHLQGVDGERVCIDQLMNPDSIEFAPGGEWGEGIVLSGRIASASQSMGSKALMRLFEVALKKNFSRVKAFYIGPMALKQFEAGIRFTSAAQSPREIDLRLSGEV